MSKTMMMDFQVDREAKQINVTRDFDAPRDLVWSAWTEHEILDQWWAPKPWKSETKHFDFSEGGPHAFFFFFFICSSTSSSCLNFLSTNALNCWSHFSISVILVAFRV